MRILDPVEIVLGSTRRHEPSEFTSYPSKKARRTLAKEIIPHPNWNNDRYVTYGTHWASIDKLKVDAEKICNGVYDLYI